MIALSLPASNWSTTLTSPKASGVGMATMRAFGQAFCYCLRFERITQREPLPSCPIERIGASLTSMSPSAVVGSSQAVISSPSRHSGWRWWMTAIEGVFAVVTSTHLAVMAAGLPQVRAVMRRRTIRPRLRSLPSARGAAETASCASPAGVCGTSRRAVDAYQHWPRGVFARSADERSISYDAIRPIGSFARRPFSRKPCWLCYRGCRQGYGGVVSGQCLRWRAALQRWVALLRSCAVSLASG